MEPQLALICDVGT